MHTTDPLISAFVLIVLAVFILGLILKELKQPHIIGYIIAGFILGPHVLGIIKQPSLLAHMGNMGVILLLFFVGLELSPKRLVENWIVSLCGTTLQILVSIIFVAIISFIFQWSWQQIILLGFIISLSSTSVVFKLLQDWHELNTK
ncbi:Iron transporter MagA (plasmid) [Aquicella lusitana]|uniref:Sodium/hydrogen exchanger family protein n=1 Tax=Aquicella lusitana TaxID=254246 RepID=A0A370G6B2_9COXI|nr:cation:proton antiporter [Aquicella lusitana]RDI37573.1 sodium/hydrogen exchanger family protein [Aquicella lusitana]VVC74699.1 Iron transporter MagA [Aquicella lusitana]